MSAPQVVWSSVEPIGAVRLAPTAEPVEMEFACEVVQVEGAVVDESTQAVFVDGSLVAVDLTWLHPREHVLAEPVVPTAYVERGLLAPLGNAVNEFYALMETCAGLQVLDRAALLAGAWLVGHPREHSASVLKEALALYGCTFRPGSGDHQFVRVGTLYVPRFWVRPAGSGEEHFDAPRWAAAGYSRDYVDDLRSRLIPVPAPDPTVVAVDPGWYLDGFAVSDAEVATSAAAGAVILPPLGPLGLADRVAAYARILDLTARHGSDNVNVVFMPENASVNEVFVGDERPGQFALLSDLRGVDYEATASAPANGESIGALTLSRLLPRRGVRTPPSAPMYVLTGVWDNADLLDDWLAHHRSLGVAGVLAMDFGSTDGSVDILTSERWASFVTMTDFPGITPNHSRILIGVARGIWPVGWALMIDPDEFLFTRTGSIDDPELHGAMSAAPAIVIPRYEMTARRSIAGPLADAPQAVDLTLRGTGRDQGKVLIDLTSQVRPSRSTHLARGSTPLDLGGSGVSLLHAPVRTFARFDQKVRHAEFTLQESPFLGPDHAWHWRRWIRIRDEGRLAAEYLDQFVDDDALAATLESGEIVVDHRLADAIRGARARIHGAPW